MLVRCMTIVVTLVLGIAAATAADDWEHQLTPYAWAVGQDGDTGTRDTVAGDLIGSYDLSPGDILERLDGAFLLAYRAEKDGTWGLVFDVVYMDLTDEGSLEPFDIDVDVSQLLVSAAYTRAIGLDSPWWWYGGLRYADLENEIRFEGTGPAGIGGSFEPGESWVDPFIGVHYRPSLSKRWNLGIMLEAGGFGVGSDATYQAMLEGGLEMTELLMLRFGYRWLDVDYDDDDFVFDAVSQGVVVGLGFNW